MSWLPSFLSTPKPAEAAAPAVVISLPPPPKQPHRQLLEYVVDRANRRRVLTIVGGGVAVIVLAKVISCVLGSHASSHGRDGRIVSDADGATGDDIEFGDPTEARFNMFVAKLYRTHEAALLKLVDDLEMLGAAREGWKQTGQMPEDLIANSRATGSSSATADRQSGEVALVAATPADVDALDSKIRQTAIHADEVLTQYVCKLDGAPVRGSPELKQRRRDMIQASHLLGERIAPFLPAPQPPHAAPPAADAETEEVPEAAAVVVEEAPNASEGARSVGEDTTAESGPEEL